MIKICDYPCKNRRQAEQEEDKHMMELKANLNMKRASRTQQEYRDDNKDKIKEYMTEYYETKKSTISEKQKEKITCDCGCEINKHHKARHQKKHMDLIDQIQ